MEPASRRLIRVAPRCLGHRRDPARAANARPADASTRDQDGIVALATGCMLLAYIEGVAAARTFAAKHGESIDLRRELLGLAAANVATAAVGGYPAAGGLSQTAVNEKAGARSRLSLVFASVTLALCLLFFTDPIADLPRAVLAAVVLMAVRGLIDFRALVYVWRASRVDLLSAMAAHMGVLLLGILQGIVLAALVSVMSVARTPLGAAHCIPGAHSRHHAILRRNASSRKRVAGRGARVPSGDIPVLSQRRVCADACACALARLGNADADGIGRVVCDLSAAPMMDLAGAQMLAELSENLQARGIGLTVVKAHGATCCAPRVWTAPSKE